MVKCWKMKPRRREVALFVPLMDTIWPNRQLLLVPENFRTNSPEGARCMDSIFSISCEMPGVRQVKIGNIHKIPHIPRCQP
jgi:hypothetical protein